MENRFTSDRIIDGKRRRVIVDINGNIIDRNPSKEGLIGKQHSIDLSGKNRISPCDGICPNGKIYDVKSSGLHRGTYWNFNANNIHRRNRNILFSSFQFRLDKS